MKLVSPIIATMLMSGIAVAEPKEEQECARYVESSIQALEFLEEQTGKPQKLGSYSKAEILSIQSKDGACAAKKVITQITIK